MKRVIVATVVLAVCAASRGVWAQEKGQLPDEKTFEVTAVAPPQPALKYQFMFDDLIDRRPGNAAILYLDSILLMGPDLRKAADKALEAYEAKDMATFDSLVDSFDGLGVNSYKGAAVFSELELAGRTEECDWQPPYRDKGADTLLPHLEPIAHGLARVVQLRALRQIEQADVEAAIKTLRLGYELSNKTGQESVLISGLVSVHVTQVMDGVTMELMNRPDSPNLYWALAEFPDRKSILRRSFDGEHFGWTASIPNIDRAARGGELLPGEWRTVLYQVRSFTEENVPDAKKRPHPDPIADATPELIAKARQAYAERRHISAEEAGNADVAVVLGNYYLQQYVAMLDDMYKLRGLAYPELLLKSVEYGGAAKRWQQEDRTNPFVEWLPTIHKAILRFAREDRELAAMTTVEAIRSYAAANGGKLPDRLEEIMETPAPANPMTAKAFEYHVDNGVATVADSESEVPLTYTVKIRK